MSSFPPGAASHHGRLNRRAGPNGETDPFGRASPPRKVYRMATLEQNKSVVRRFMTEVLQGGNLDLVDEPLSSPDLGQLLAPFLPQAAHA